MNQDYPAQVSKWSVFEITLEGPSEGNPFTEQYLNGIFSGRNECVITDGFYDGEGIYKIRFMPSYEGKYTFVLKGSFLNTPLSGAFYVGAPDENNHGVVRVVNTHHFAYEDGTPYIPVGTTAYVWNLQSDELIQETLKSLEEARFNKIRFCVFPKHYAFNLGEPRSYPYEGTPMDSSVLNDENFMAYIGKTEGNNFDYNRFNPEHFRQIEYCIEELGRRGIEADLICMHPYDRWGFSSMTAEQDDLYWKYIIARFSAYHNVWWALANEYDLMKAKTLADWERYASILMKKDPYKHLRSIHNCRKMYDHSRPWITHCSVQRIDLYKGAELTGELAERYGKPVVMDEIAYEGNIQYGWGNISGEELIRRFWETAVRGGYPGHGETYLNDENILWWSHGGTLRGESWKRAGFLLDVLKEVPGNGLAEADLEWDSVCGVPESEWFEPVKSQYLFYYSFMRPSFRDFHIDDETDFIAEVIDTWEMTVRKAGIHKGAFRIALPGKPYMAIRLRKPTEEDWLNPVDEEPAEEEPVVEEELIEEEEAAFTALETVDEAPAEEPEETEVTETEEPEEEPEFDLEEEPEPEEEEAEAEPEEEEPAGDEEEEETELPEVTEEEPVAEDEEMTQELEQQPLPAYTYKHGPGRAGNVEEEIPEYTVPGEESVHVEDELMEGESEEIDLTSIELDDDEELPDIVSGAIETVDSYDDREPELAPELETDEDELEGLIEEATKTLDIPNMAFTNKN
ncbi:MAG: DUF5605 domain-containing protein [Solobacterium sp.]|nr:DUF5605 domain-containing protein [Solobacterium sp.]